MPRSTAKPQTPSPQRVTLRSVLVFVVALLGIVGTFLALAYLGDEARDQIINRDRYRVRFADIDCPAPPGMDRETFLREVRYVSGVPETLSMLEPDFEPSIAAAFAAHPWVESVERIERHPPKQVGVMLRFREPVLVVPKTSGGYRIVDRTGVLLPPVVQKPDLPELIADVSESRSPAGQLWEDATVQRAVELVKLHPIIRLERTPAGWTLTTRDGKLMHVDP